MTARAMAKPDDVARIVRGVRKGGERIRLVRVDPDGTISVYTADSELPDQPPDNIWDQE